MGCLRAKRKTFFPCNPWLSFYPCNPCYNRMLYKVARRLSVRNAATPVRQGRSRADFAYLIVLCICGKRVGRRDVDTVAIGIRPLGNHVRPVAQRVAGSSKKTPSGMMTVP